MSSPASVLELRSVSKRFPGVQALDTVDFDLARGEVHALMGENGAGKSTLIKLITGVHHFDHGEMLLDGAPIRPESPADAQRLGISSVYQEVNLLPNLSVAHNLFLGHEPRRFGCIRWRAVHADARRLLARFRLDIEVRQSLSAFSIAVQQLVAIARGVDRSAKVLVLDEPTASLDAAEVDLLFGIIAELKRTGIAIVFVTHFLDQVYAVSDRITVLRNGLRVGTYATQTLPRSELVAQMLGKELEAVEREKGGPPAGSERAPVIRALGLAADNGLRGVSFSAHAGEALGLAGLLGSGRTELCETLFGLAATIGGSLTVDGATLRLGSPREAMRRGFALCPEDRKSAGIVGSLSIRENVVLALQARRGWWRRLPPREQTRLAEQAIDELDIVCPGAESPVETLSGGNQQRVILARWLCNQPRILILDEPTRGIDVGAHAEIIRLIRSLRDQGLTVIVASSEIEELVAFSDKVLVMRDMAAAAELAGDEVSEPAIVGAIAESV
jgi:monosaccharide-transporting ATPase